MRNMKPQIERWRTPSRVSLVLFLLAAHGCNVSFASPDAPLGPDDRGRRLGNVGTASAAAMAWSNSSRELYVQGETGQNLVAIDVVVGGTPRVIEERLARFAYYGQIIVSPDGAQLYYSLNAPHAATLYVRQLAGGQATPIGTVSLAGASITPDSKQLLYVDDSDSLFAYTAATGATRFLRSGCRAIQATSPDSREVLCRTANPPGAFERVSIADGTASSVVIALPASDEIALVRWTSDGIRVLHRHFAEYYISNVQTGATARVLADSGNIVSGYDSRFDWSRDGRTLALWHWHCIRATGILSCDIQEGLTLLDVGTFAATQIATVNMRSGTMASAPLLSPDDKRIAYEAGGTFYVKDVP